MTKLGTTWRKPGGMAEASPVTAGFSTLRPVEPRMAPPWLLSRNFTKATAPAWSGAPCRMVTV